MNRHILFRVLSGLVLLGVIIALGIFAYNAGIMRGQVLNVQVPAGEAPAPAPAPYYYGMPYRMHAWGFPGFGFLGCLVPLFLIFLAFIAMRGMFGFRRHGWYGMQHGPWGMHSKDPNWDPEKGVPGMFAEWHRRAHEQPEAPKEEQ